MMNRRQAIKNIGILFGGSFVGAQALLTGCTTRPNGFSLSGSDLAFINDIGEAIIPATATSGGAKAADVAGFISRFVRDFYTAEEQNIFKNGITAAEKLCRDLFGNDFGKLTSAQQEEVLWALESEAATQGNGTHYYMMMKQLVIWTYFTSETAAKQAFEFRPAPGEFIPVTDYSPGDKLPFHGLSRELAGRHARYHINSRTKKGDQVRISKI
jgi:hypothetical protein